MWLICWGSESRQTHIIQSYHGTMRLAKSSILTEAKAWEASLLLKCHLEIVFTTLWSYRTSDWSGCSIVICFELLWHLATGQCAVTCVSTACFCSWQMANREVLWIWLRQEQACHVTLHDALATIQNTSTLSHILPCCGLIPGWAGQWTG